MGRSEYKENLGLAFVDGAAVTFDAAVLRCAEILAGSAQPLFAHLGADTAGVAEAVRLAELTGGVLDHAASESLLRDLCPLRESGGLVTTPLEANLRADLVLLVGDLANDLAWLEHPAHPDGEKIERQVISCANSLGANGTLVSLAKLRAAVKLAPSSQLDPLLESQARALRGAKFGVAVWRASDLSPLAVEAIHALVRDLNETTRFSTLALPQPDNGVGAQMVCGWMTGFPLRTGFGRGWPEHDPWRYDAQRLIAAGEIDCVLWVSSLPGGAKPPDRVDILLDEGEATLATVPRVRIAVSSPGQGAVLFDPRVGTLTVQPDGQNSALPTVAATLAAVRAQLGAGSC